MVKAKVEIRVGKILSREGKFDNIILDFSSKFFVGFIKVRYKCKFINFLIMIIHEKLIDLRILTMKKNANSFENLE